MESSKSSPLILIVDDNPVNLSVLANTLTSSGFDIAVEPDGESAIAQVESNPPDLILLDIQMPGLDGFETCERLKANPLTHDIPIIFITALSDTTDKVKGFSLGAVDYITKPFQQEEVLARVRLHLKLRFLTKTLEQQNIRLKHEIEQRQETEAELQKTLKQLQAAQTQIVAQEKLASLGILTAGIAHELRNPLNFVNNYAEGSVELTEELLEEIDNQAEHLDAGILDYIKQMLIDIRDNAAAIHQHGQRAEGTIQSMMQHARTGGGQRQLTELNALLDQAVQLAYHSRRAIDSDCNAVICKDYDDSIGQLEVVSCDLNRAFINIVDNACYAICVKQKHYQQQEGNDKRGRLSQEGEDFTPTLWLKTRNLREAVEICIRDNGMGIPSEIKETIFHPFFTTKPAGEGTGLGLSLTHDIIVGQHGGTLQVKSEPGAFTEFIITLPRVLPV
jgi:signal transduction histidine kinase